MGNAKTGLILAGLAALAYVGFSKRDSISQLTSTSFDSSVFTSRAKAQSDSVTNPLFNAGLDRQINSIQSEINKATKAIINLPTESQKFDKNNPRPVLTVDRSTADFLAGKTGKCNASCQAQVYAAQTFQLKQQNQIKTNQYAQNFINEQNQKIALLESQRKGL